MRFMLNYQRLEKIATAAVTLARRPHVSVPCQPMNRLHHQDQSVKPSCHDVTGPPLNESKHTYYLNIKILNDYYVTLQL